ncbi:YraN family protein [Candidatus Magnetaquicoccus inordinatus]|uniref:YraN family protein n=1 Tax=Candidatus Magnetaquicoccus inordinatus TaxID=2496818 RepID=UPI00187D3125|nr:YraN family protein [Candidatus Magnetaquicoccus inordinatus]
MAEARRLLGSEAEQVAERYLHKHGYCILERNVRFRQGELDLVALHGETLVFCEVKASHGTSMLDPADNLHRRKQDRLVRLAAGYLQKHPEHAGRECRFDAVLVWKRGLWWSIEVVADAFRPGW